MAIFWQKIRSAVPTVIFAVSLAGNVTLGLLAVKWHHSMPAMSIVNPDAPKLGTYVSSLNVSSLHGDDAVLSLSQKNRPTVLYVFTPTCVWCLRNKQKVFNLAAAEHDRYDFVGLSLTAKGINQYLASSPFNFPVYVVNEGKLPINFKLTLTPDTFVFSQDGELEHIFDGYYTSDTAASISSLFGVHLE
jgi:thioredoxin-related protein